MIYLDNAATSYPKPPMVVRAMAGTLSRLGGNPGRSGHKLSLCGGRVIEHCREILAEELEAPAAEQIVFTSGCTEALNLAIRGSLFRGDEVLCSHAEHNAVMRVLKGLEQQGEITVRVAEPDSRGLLSPEALRQATTPKTALCVLNHASNVTGVVQPVRELADALRPMGIPVLVDAAQTAGILPVSLKKLGADMIALPGHKGLLGPHGTGVLALGRGMQPGRCWRAARDPKVRAWCSRSRCLTVMKAVRPICRELPGCWPGRGLPSATERRSRNTNAG